MPLIENRPFRVIHHTASEASIIWGGRDSRPGEISLAHKWILFLDEFLEFNKSLLETLRQPLEDGEITINRVNQSCRYPARFSLIGAMNPCPCGYMWDPEKPCTCSPLSIDKYRSRLSGTEYSIVSIYSSKYHGWRPGNSVRSEVVRRVVNSNSSSCRLARCNERDSSGRVSTPTLRCRTSTSSSSHPYRTQRSRSPYLRQRGWSSRNRVYYRILRVARTIADIDGSREVEVKHVLEALSYRGS